MSKIVHLPCSIVKIPQDNKFSAKESGNLEKVKIVVMHSGLNGNRSDFSDMTIEDAKPTISNIPILAFIKRDDDGNAIDFDQHNVITKIVQGEDGYDIEEFYLERPIGVIPESNNYRIEEINGMNHVVVDGYIWKCYSNEGYNLISETGEKSVSMEISIEDGYKDESTGVYNITKYSYLGVTVLGDDVTPAMGYTCKLETYSSNQELQNELEELNNEVKKYQKEVKIMEETQVQETVIVDATEVKVEDIQTETKVEETKQVDNVQEEVETTDEEQEDEKIVFTKRISELESKVSDLENQIASKDTELAELRAFKLTKDKEALQVAVNEVIAQFSDLEESDYKEVMEKTLNGEISVDTFKFNMYAIKGMKQEAKEKLEKENYSKQSSEDATETAKVSVTSNIYETSSNFSVSSRYGSLVDDLKRISSKI